MKTVFLFIDKAHFISDLLSTNYICYLSSKYKVVLFTRDIDQKKAYENNYFQSPNLTYLKWKPKNSTLLDLMKFIRFSCIREFDYLDTVKLYRKRRDQDNEKTLLRFISKPFAFFLTANFFNKVESFFCKGSREFAGYCKKYNPILTLVATPGINNFEAEAIILSKKYDIKTVSIDCNWDGLTTRATRIRSPDYFIAWHEPMRQEAIKIHHYDPNRVFVSGPVRFDYHFTREEYILSHEEFLISKGLDPKYKTILYTTQKGHLFEEGFVKNLIYLRDSGLIPYVNIFLRVHPVA